MDEETKTNATMYLKRQLKSFNSYFAPPVRLSLSKIKCTIAQPILFTNTNEQKVLFACLVNFITTNKPFSQKAPS